MNEEIESALPSEEADIIGDGIVLFEESKQTLTTRLKRFLKISLYAGLALLLFLHLYLFILLFIPAPLTLNMIMSADPLRRKPVALSDISPNLMQAVIAAEDTRFCEHKGLDMEAVQKAIQDNQSGGRRRGGSTISQQTAKNVIFWNGGGYIRKAGEAYVTVIIEIIWPKQKIMEHYLNIADWGNGIYGAEMAAQIRFKKSARNLSIYEAALLASVLPNPHKWRVDPPGNYVSQRVQTIQSRMAVVARDGLATCVMN